MSASEIGNLSSLSTYPFHAKQHTYLRFVQIYFNPAKDTLNFDSLNAFFAFVGFLLQPSQDHVSVLLSEVGKIWVREELVETLHHITFEMKFERKDFLMHLLLPILSKLKTVKFLAASTDEEVRAREVGLQIMTTSAEKIHGSGYVLPLIGLVTPSQLKRVVSTQHSRIRYHTNLQ